MYFATKKQQDIAMNRLLFSALSQCERLLQGAGGYGIRPYGVGCILLPRPWALWIVGDAICLTTIPQPAILSAPFTQRGQIKFMLNIEKSIVPYLSSVEPKRMLPRALSWSSKVLSLGSSASTNVICLSQNLPMALSSSRL